jgi:predicted metal-binding membrane protein
VGRAAPWRRPDWVRSAWDRGGPLLAGVVIVAVGAYQLTPLKRSCLRHCRSPLSFVLHGWRPGLPGALRMGLREGGWCVGCCAGLMALMFVLGAMSLFWMGVVTALVFAEKLVSVAAVRPIIATVCVVLGVCLALAPIT